MKILHDSCTTVKSRGIPVAVYVTTHVHQWMRRGTSLHVVSSIAQQINESISASYSANACDACPSNSYRTCSSELTSCLRPFHGARAYVTRHFPLLRFACGNPSCSQSAFLFPPTRSGGSQHSIVEWLYSLSCPSQSSLPSGLSLQPYSASYPASSDKPQHLLHVLQQGSPRRSRTFTRPYGMRAHRRVITQCGPRVHAVDGICSTFFAITSHVFQCVSISVVVGNLLLSSIFFLLYSICFINCCCLRVCAVLSSAGAVGGKEGKFLGTKNGGSVPLLCVSCCQATVLPTVPTSIHKCIECTQFPSTVPGTSILSAMQGPVVAWVQLVPHNGTTMRGGSTLMEPP